ncbi:hypothetical protein M8J71_23055 [Pseudarthrobacter sp. R1]|uniref:hypothetical protein n=1 Tax=Pseudarthrobacter sp. R1 TaxID=2944934 RepID=UPI00210AFF0F|nr:hypothetical protein [Pseudarthrobacter sp. R1]MCQ6273325.1 hypothetical protein [Pseudarthrobacter sp. R1]
MAPTSFELFDWNGLRPDDEIEVLGDGLIISCGVIEDLNMDQDVIRLKLSYGRGRRTYRREDGWQVRKVCKTESPAHNGATPAKVGHTQS